MVAGGLAVEEAHITALIHAGLLVRQLANQEAFWFAIPDVGSLLKMLVQGRKELLGLVSRRKHREILRRDLERRRLRYSQLGFRFHLRDLIGSNQLVETPTTVGPMVKIPR
eukprot:jgi/Mesen1/3763/ME000205S03023